MTKKLNETQIRMLAIATCTNKGAIAPAPEGSNDRGYWNTISALIKRDLVERGGAATGSDYNKDGWRYIVTEAGYRALDDARDDEEMSEIIVEIEDEAYEGDTEIEAEDEAEEDSGREYIKRRYREKYILTGRNGDGCGDELDCWIAETFTYLPADAKKPVLDLEGFIAFAEGNGINANKYRGLNNGMIRMNVTNRLRGMIRKGTPILHNGHTIFQGKAA